MQNDSLFTFRPRARVNRLNKAELAHARDQRLKEIQMWSIIREVLTYLCFVWILYVISYANRDGNSFRQVDHLRQFFLNSRQPTNDYTKVRTLSSFVPAIKIIACKMTDFDNRPILELAGAKFCVEHSRSKLV